MVIKSSSAREVDRLVTHLRDGSPVEREAAIARLRVIGARAVDRLLRVIASDAAAAVHAAALKAVEGAGDARVRDAALARLDAETPAVAAAAIAVLRPWLATDASVLDAVTALALDKTRKPPVRIAALDALSDLPRRTIQPVIQQLGGDDPLAAEVAGEPGASRLDHPSGVREWLKVRGAAAPLSEIHDAIARIREREREEPSAKRRQEWQAARGAAHQVLASRQSRVALYDLRETFDEAESALPRDFVAAMTALGDAACLDSLARAWMAAAREPWWRARVAEAARAIVAREKLTARHSAVRRLKSRFPGLLP